MKKGAFRKGFFEEGVSQGVAHRGENGRAQPG